MSACGSTDALHRTRTCTRCHRIYRDRVLAKKGLPRYLRIPATCAFCGLSARNSLGVKVLRYPLLRRAKRNGRESSVCIGSMGICDQCVRHNATLNQRALQGKAA